ncbi:unnamed protein product [Closterium sp. Yama58-4]|nr:unnamed protein product [Closterium sp. Yama58-4]
MATDMEANASQLGLSAPASSAPFTTPPPPSPSSEQSSSSAPNAAAAASLPSLWARLSDRLSQAFRALLSPPPSRASRSSPTLPSSRASPSASSPSATSPSAPPPSVASASATAPSASAKSPPYTKEKAGVGEAGEGAGGAGDEGRGSSLARLVGEVRAKGSLLEAADEALEEESRWLQSKADELAASIRGRLSVDDVQAVVGAAVGNVQTELVRARRRTKQLLAQLEIKDTELRLRREEWEKERAAMVATLDALVRKGTLGGAGAGRSDGGEAGGAGGAAGAAGAAVEMVGDAGEGRRGVGDSMSFVGGASLTAPVEAMTRGMSLTDAMMRILSLEAAVARAEEAEQATSVRLERVADVLGCEIAKLRKDKKSIEIRAQMLTWRLEMMQQKLEGLLGGLMEIRGALIGGKVELGVQLLEELVFDVETWTRQGRKLMEKEMAGWEGGKGAGERGERDWKAGQAGRKEDGEGREGVRIEVGEGGVEGEEGEGGVVSVRAGWWKEGPPGEWSVYEEREDGRLVELGEERREQEERRKVEEEEEAAREAEERERRRLLEEERGKEGVVEEEDGEEVSEKEGKSESEREAGAVEIPVPQGDDVDQAEEKADAGQSREDADVQIGGSEVGEEGAGGVEETSGEEGSGGLSEPERGQPGGGEEGMQEESGERREGGKDEEGGSGGGSEESSSQTWDGGVAQGAGESEGAAEEEQERGVEEEEEKERDVEEEREKEEREAEEHGEENGDEEGGVVVEEEQVEPEHGELESSRPEEVQESTVSEDPDSLSLSSSEGASKEEQEAQGEEFEGQEGQGEQADGAAAEKERAAGVTLYYETGWQDVFVHFCADGAVWTDVPGLRMDDSPLIGLNGLPLKVITLPVTAMEFVTNNGGTDWDSPPLGGNYTINGPGIYLLRKAGFLSTTMVDIKAAFTTTTGWTSAQPSRPFIDMIHGVSAVDIRHVFNLMDRDRDGRISTVELASVLASLGETRPDDMARRMMAQADTDGDGFVDFNEFLAVNKACVGVTGSGRVAAGSRISSGRSGSTGSRGSSMEELEIPRYGNEAGAGEICLASAGDADMAVVDSPDSDSASMDDLLAAFRSFDKNGDGYITPDELREMLLRIGAGEDNDDGDVSLAECERMIRRVDADGDGRVCFSEFVNMMSGDNNGLSNSC